MARKKKSSIVGAVADSVTDAVSSAIDALAHPATTVGQARDAIMGATRKAAGRATKVKRKVAAKKGTAKRAVKKAVAKVRRKVAAKKGTAKRAVKKAVKKAAKKVRRR